MAMITAIKFYYFILPVYALASLIALITASVPELTNLIILLKASFNDYFCKRNFKFSGAPKVVPFLAVSIIVFITFLSACPKINGP